MRSRLEPPDIRVVLAGPAPAAPAFTGTGQVRFPALRRARRIVYQAAQALRAPPALRFRAWAERHGRLAGDAEAEPGLWRALPYQRGIMDALDDPAIERVSLMKSGRVGYTQILGLLVGFLIDTDPCAIMVVQPTVEDAKNYSKETLGPQLEAIPALRAKLPPARTRDGRTTTLLKRFRGGLVSLVGANSPRGFRRVSRRVVIFDELDGYPLSAGAEGDQYALGVKRTESFWNRKIIAGSTPTQAGLSRIEALFLAGDQRHFVVPCPRCEWRHVLEPRQLRWTPGEPDDAHFVCPQCQGRIEHHEKHAVVEAGRWQAAAPTRRHASFHIWTAYSSAANATWADIARESEDAHARGPEAVRTFVNMTCGEPHQERTEAPDWKQLRSRQSSDPPGRVPPGVLFLTAGADVQPDRVEVSIWGWGRAKRRWLVDHLILEGDIAREDVWDQLTAAGARTWQTATGLALPLARGAIDTQFATTQVHSWARRQPAGRWVLVRGAKEPGPVLVSLPRPAEALESPARRRRRQRRRGLRVWEVNTHAFKVELYGYLALTAPAPGEPPPAGWIGLPAVGDEFLRQLVAETLVRRRLRSGLERQQWEKIYRRNEALDCAIYARAAAHLVGVDRFTDAEWETYEAPFQAAAAAARGAPTSPAPAEPPAPRVVPPPGSGGPPVAWRQSSYWDRPRRR